MDENRLLTRRQAIRQAEKLYEAGLLTPDWQKMLLRHIRECTQIEGVRWLLEKVFGYKLLKRYYLVTACWNGFDFAGYCRHSAVFDTTSFLKDDEDLRHTTEHYTLIFEKIRGILPGFNYTDFSVSGIEKERGFETGSNELHLNISLSVGETRYSYRFYDRPILKNGYKSASESFSVTAGFQKVINKWLADLNSPQRLYFMHATFCEGVQEPYKCALLLMTEKQYAAWTTHDRGYLLYPECHDNRFNTEGIKKMMKQYEDIGLLAHLSGAEMEMAWQQIAEAGIYNHLALLQCIPGIVLSINLSVWWQNPKPYEVATMLFVHALRGVFTPKNIIDTFSDESENVYFGFEFNEKIYQVELDMNRSQLEKRGGELRIMMIRQGIAVATRYYHELLHRLSRRWIQLVARALEEARVDVAIYCCSEDGNLGGLSCLLLNRAQYEFFKVHQPELQLVRQG